MICVCIFVLGFFVCNYVDEYFDVSDLLLLDVFFIVYLVFVVL